MKLSLIVATLATKLALGLETAAFSLTGNLFGANEPTLIVNSEDGSSIKLAYDPDEEMLIFYANVKIGSYIGLGFGETMVDTEII